MSDRAMENRERMRYPDHMRQPFLACIGIAVMGTLAAFGQSGVPGISFASETRELSLIHI